MSGHHMKKKTSGFIALILAVVMIISCVDLSAFADIVKQLASQTPKISIIYVEALTNAVTSQNLTVGSEESDVVLPNTLIVKVDEEDTTTVSTVSGTSAANPSASASGNISTGTTSTTATTASHVTVTKQVAVTWSLDVENSTTITYSSAKAGNVYVYEPVLSGDDADTYVFADSVKLPLITVTIVKSEAVTRIEELIDSLPDASEIASMKDEKLETLYETIDEIETLAEENDIDLEEYEKYVEVYAAITQLSAGADTPMVLADVSDSTAKVHAQEATGTGKGYGYDVYADAYAISSNSQKVTQTTFSKGGWSWTCYKSVTSSYPYGGIGSTGYLPTGTTVTYEYEEGQLGGNYVLLKYTITAPESQAITDGKLGVHADVCLSNSSSTTTDEFYNSDKATLSKIIDSSGKATGVKMTHLGKKTSTKYQFNLIVSGELGSTAADTIWCGLYSNRFGNVYVDSDNNPVTGIDSGLAWSWQNINIEAGQSKTYCALVGIGAESSGATFVSESDGGYYGNVKSWASDDTTVKAEAVFKDTTSGVSDFLYYTIKDSAGNTVSYGQAGEAVKAGDDAAHKLTGEINLNTASATGGKLPAGTYTVLFNIVNTAGAKSTENSSVTMVISADGGVKITQPLPDWATAAGFTTETAEMVDGALKLIGSGDTITTTSTIQIPEGSNVTIDLNGNTLKSASGSVISVENGDGTNTEITITDNSTGGTKGKIVGNSGCATIDMSGVSSTKTATVTVTNGATVQGAEGSSEDGASTNGGTAIALGDRSSATISDGGQVLGGSSSTGNGGDAITGGSESSVTIKGTDTVVNGGDSTSSTGKGGTAITTSGTVIVEGGTVTGGDGATGANAITSTKSNTGEDTTATVTVTDGTITGGNSKGTDSSGNGIAGGNGIEAAGNVSATGGTVNGGNGSNSSSASEGSGTTGGVGGVGIKSTSGTVTLGNGATVTGGSGGSGATNGASGDSVTDNSGTVKGTPGWFKDLQKELQADGLTDATVTIDSSGDVTITLTGDNTLTDSLTLPAGVNITIDTAGYTIKGEQSLPAISISSSASGSKSESDNANATIKIKGSGSIIGADGTSGSAGSAGGDGATAIDASGATTGTTITIENTTVKGGNGGTGSSDGSSDTSNGGNGGNAITGNNGVSITITSGTVSGGNGGTGTTGGSGGSAISTAKDVTINSGSVSGGNGADGTGANGIGGNGGAAVTGVESTTLGTDSDGNSNATVTGGSGGAGASSGGSGGNAGVEGGTSGTNGVGTAVYDAAKSELLTEYNSKLAKLEESFTDNCTEEDKTAAKNALQDAYDSAVAAVEAAKTNGNTAVQDAKTAGDTAMNLVISQANALISMRDALAELDTKSADATAQINGLHGLYTDEEVSKAESDTSDGSAVEDTQKKSTYTTAITSAVTTAKGDITKSVEDIFNMTSGEVTEFTGKLDDNSADSAISIANKAIDDQLATAKTASDNFVNTKTAAIDSEIEAALTKLATWYSTGIETTKLTKEEYDSLAARIDAAKGTFTREISNAESVTAADAAKKSCDENIAKILNDAQLTIAKTAAKNAVADKVTAAKAEIDAMTNLTDEQKDDFKKKIDTELGNPVTEANSAIAAVTLPSDEESTDEGLATAKNSVTAAKTTAIDAISAIVSDANSQASNNLDAAKTKAKEAIAADVTSKKEAIDAMPGLTEEQKTAAKNAIEEKAAAADSAIGETTEITAVNTAKTTYDTEADTVVSAYKTTSDNKISSTKAEKTAELETAADEKKSAINGFNNLTDAEKQQYIKEIDDKLTEAKNAVNSAANITDIEDIASGADAAYTLTKDKATALDGLNDEAAKQKSAIDALGGLTEEEKTAAKNEIDARVSESKSEINRATDGAAADVAADTGKTAISGIVTDKTAAANATLNEGKTAAVEALNAIADEKIAAINDMSSLTADEKRFYTELITSNLTETQTTINNATDLTDIDNAKKTGQAIAELLGTMADAQNELDKYRELKNDYLQKLEGLDETETSGYQSKVTEAVADAIADIKTAGNEGKGSSDGVNTALENGKSAVDTIMTAARKVANENRAKGVISNTTTPSANEAQAVLNDTKADELESKVVTEDEDLLRLDNGADISVWLEVGKTSDVLSNGIDESYVEEVTAEKSKIDADFTSIKTASGTSEIVAYYDIHLMMQIGSEAAKVVKETNGELSVTLTVPTEAVNTNSSVERTYKILRAHTSAGATEPATKMLDCVYDAAAKTITFKTDEFSTYALFYVDTNISTTNTTKVNPTGGGGWWYAKRDDKTTATQENTSAATSTEGGTSQDSQTVASNTGDTANWTILIALLIVSATAFTAAAGRRRKTK